MNNISRSAYKLADDALEALLNLHFKYLCCEILFDAESYNFEDTKPFFEGERISYSIQMWKLYMEGLHHDAVYFLPQSFAQEIYGKVLSFSLDRFLMRYSKSQVTEARHSQLLRDIYTILICMTELIYPACSYVSEVTGKKEEFNETKIVSVVSKIHSSCCCLLSVLVILTSPLSELYKVFKVGFPQPRLSIRSKYECLSPWLPWIRRELFSDLGQNKIMSNVAVWLAVKVCTTYKVPLPSSIIKAFTEHHCTLSILLMMQASRINEDPDFSEEVEKNKINLSYSLSVLMLCYDSYSYLLDIFLPVIEKSNGWDEFDATSANKTLLDRPWWYAGLYKAFKPFLQSAFEEMASFWFEIKKKTEDSDTLKEWINFRDELKNYVVCVCQNNSLNSFNENFIVSTQIISFLCAKKMLEKLHDNLMFLPMALKYTLICLDAHIVNYMPEILPSENSVCIQFLISSSITYLKEKEFIDNLPVVVQDMALVTSDALYAVCKSDDSFFKNIHYKKKLIKILTAIKEEFDLMRTDFDTQSKHSNSDEIQDDILTLTAKKIVEVPEGIDIILYLHKLLYVNEDWIRSNLGIPEMLSSDIVVSPISPSPLLRTDFESPIINTTKKKSCSENQTSNITAQKFMDTKDATRDESFDSERSMEQTYVMSPAIMQLHKKSEMNKKNDFNLLVDEITIFPMFNFNPFDSYNKLGASSFTKVALDRPCLPWEALLSHLPILGITEINFQVLFSKRWDVSSEVTLSSEEMRQIEELKNLYKYEE